MLLCTGIIASIGTIRMKTFVALWGSVVIELGQLGIARTWCSASGRRLALVEHATTDGSEHLGHKLLIDFDQRQRSPREHAAKAC
jgi:hypothetical protein